MTDEQTQADEMPEPAAEPAPEEEAPAIDAGPKRPVEEWAKEKGDLVLGPFGGPDPRAPRYWRFVAARAAAQWPTGAEVTEADYDKALEDAGNVEVR